MLRAATEFLGWHCVRRWTLRQRECQSTSLQEFILTSHRVAATVTLALKLNPGSTTTSVSSLDSPPASAAHLSCAYCAVVGEATGAAVQRPSMRLKRRPMGVGPSLTTAGEVEGDDGHRHHLRRAVSRRLGLTGSLR